MCHARDARGVLALLVVVATRKAFVVFVDGQEGNISPFIGGSLTLIDIKNGKTAKPANYEKDYIKTFVNVSNTVFKDAGIFAVGIDSHFAGEALHDGINVGLSSTFKGSVQLHSRFGFWLDNLYHAHLKVFRIDLFFR